MSDKVKNTLLVVLSVIVIGFLAYFIYQYYFKEAPPVQMTVEDSMDPVKVKEAINDNGNIRIDDYQAQTITKEITRIVEVEKPPQTIYVTTGATYQEDIKKNADMAGADEVIITPAPGEEKTLEEIQEDDVVQVNQYNIKAYPKNLLSVARYSDGEITVDYQTKVKVFGAQAYIGPSVKLEKDGSGDAVVGVKLTIPL